MKLPLTPDRQWPRTVKVVLVYSYGLKIMTKSKNRPTKCQFFHENHQLDKVAEMKGTNGSFVHVGFSRTGIERLKNWSGKCEGPGKGDRRVKELE